MKKLEGIKNLIINLIPSFVILCIVIIVLVPIFIHTSHREKNIINEKVKQREGTLVESHQTRFLEKDPFKWYEHGKNVHIWEFKYKDKSGQEHVGWARFSMNTIWKMDGDN